MDKEKIVDPIQERYNTHDWDWNHTDLLGDPDAQCRTCGIWLSAYPWGCFPECRKVRNKE